MKKNQTPQEKPAPAYLREDYPFQPDGKAITDLSSLQPTGVLYEIRCNNPECELCVRTQGVNVPRVYEKLTTDGCMYCEKKDFSVFTVIRK